MMCWWPNFGFVCFGAAVTTIIISEFYHAPESPALMYVTNNPRFGLLCKGQSEIGRFGLIRIKSRLRRDQDRPQLDWTIHNSHTKPHQQLHAQNRQHCGLETPRGFILAFTDRGRCPASRPSWMSKMLRRTNRLSRFLADHDRVPLLPKGPWVEAEFQGTPESAGTDRDAENTVFPLPEIDITTLCELVDGVTHEVSWIYLRAAMTCCRPSILQDTSIPVNATLDVLWLSATEFVSWHDFRDLLRDDFLVEKMCSIQVSERLLIGGRYESRFNVFKLNPANAEAPGNPLELPFHFLVPWNQLVT
jgi:hypothetical protein